MDDKIIVLKNAEGKDPTYDVCPQGEGRIDQGKAWIWYWQKLSRRRMYMPRDVWSIFFDLSP